MAQETPDYPVWFRTLASAAIAACLTFGPANSDTNTQMLQVEVLEDEPVTVFLLDYWDALYTVRLGESRGTVGGDLTVLGVDPSSPTGTPERVAAVADFVCNGEGRFFSPEAGVETSGDRTVWTFVEACH
jgi:hypothetical protein